MPTPCAGAGAEAVLAATMGALYTGRGPVCGITTRRGATTGRADAGVNSGVVEMGASGSAATVSGAAEASFAFAATSASLRGGLLRRPVWPVPGFQASPVLAGPAVLVRPQPWQRPALGPQVLVRRPWGRWSSSRRLYHNRWRNDRHDRTRRGSCRSLGHYGPDRRLRCNCWSGRRNNRRSRPRLRHNLPRLRPRRGCWRRCNRNYWWCGLCRAFGAVAAALLGGIWLLRASASSSCFLARIAFITSPGLET